MSGIDIARDDLALDALDAGRAPGGGDEVLGLLHAFRTDLDAEPADQGVVDPVRAPRRRAALIALSAAAGLVLGGLTAGAVVTADEPGQLFYAAHKAVLGDPKAAERVTKLLDDAAEELAEGDREAARDKLDKAAERLGDVEDPAARAELRDRLARLSALASAVPSPSRGGEGPSSGPSPDDDETPEPAETESPDDDSGSGSDGSGSGDSSGKGSGGSSGKGSGDSSGSGSDH